MRPRGPRNLLAEPERPPGAAESLSEMPPPHAHAGGAEASEAGRAGCCELLPKPDAGMLLLGRQRPGAVASLAHRLQ